MELRDRPLVARRLGCKPRQVFFAFHGPGRLDAEVAVDLEAALRRGCPVDVVFETSEDSAGAYPGPERPFAQVAAINRCRWLAEQRGTVECSMRSSW